MEKFLIAEGSSRQIYQYPDDLSKCIKITTEEGKLYHKNRNKHWYKKLKPLNSFDESLKEIKAYKKFKYKDSAIYNHIPKFYGIVKTNLGDGMVLDYINDSVSLFEFINIYGVTDDLISAMKEIFTVFIKNNIEIRDYTSNNFLVKKINGNLRIYFIDGLGNANLIPISELIPYFGMKKIVRRLKKMLNNLSKMFPLYADKFNFYKILNS